MSVQEIVAAVNLAVEKSAAASAHLQQAGQAAEEASQALGQAAQGTSDQELGQAVGALAQAVQDVGGVGQLVARAAGDLSAYAKSLAGDQGGQGEGGGQASGQSAPSGKKKDDEPDDPVEQARQELPERATGRGAKGVKTSGRWFAPGKTTSAVTSGIDNYTDQVNSTLKEAGCPYEPVTAAADVELKIAAEMREKGITEATVVINNVPCEGPASCDSLLGVVLPEGSSMTVHGTGGFKKTYRGGVNPWRR